jgi:aminoglycoside phosphotransferase family enzyme
VTGSEPGLDDKVRFLRSSSSYPHGPDEVIAKETHMSWVFLAAEKAFKLKKPVRYSYLDFSTLAARETYCREEIRLNRRLAPGVYQGVRALMRSPSGSLALDGGGEVVDWLVEMRRLPAERMLDARLKEGAVDGTDLASLAGILAEFYRNADHPPIDPEKPFRHFADETEMNRAVLLRPEFLAGEFQVEVLLARVEAALLNSRARLRERALRGHIVDGHGDLRPEHICLTDPVVIFDRLEFSADLRLVDPFDELSFLGLECAILAAPRVGPDLIRRVAGLLGEDVPRDLVGLYTALHAVLRARLSLAHLLDPVPREPAKWMPQARRYLALAEEALAADAGVRRT